VDNAKRERANMSKLKNTNRRNNVPRPLERLERPMGIYLRFGLIIEEIE
jgi:hypothetical protein